MSKGEFCWIYLTCWNITDEIQHAVEITTEMMVHYPDHDRLKNNMKYFKGLVEKGEVVVDESRSMYHFLPVFILDVI